MSVLSLTCRSDAIRSPGRVSTESGRRDDNRGKATWKERRGHVDGDAIFTPLIGSLKADGVKPAAVADRQMTRRCRSGIKMLMKPAAGRAIDASLFPFNLYYLIAAATLIGPGAELFVPQQNIS